MKSTLHAAALASVLAATIPHVHAACDVQSVAVSSGKVELARWDGASPEIHRITLPNGFNVGLKIEPASAAKNAETAKQLNDPTIELVKISIYDLQGPQPKQLAYTWGGVNSLQGYGPKGGATRVTEVGEPGIELKLTKPKCANPNNV